MGDFVTVGRASEVRPGQRKCFWVEEIRLLVLNIDGEYYATDDSCPHRECPLDDAVLNGKVIVCPCHAAQFNVETGEVLVHPVGFPPTVPIPVHQVKVQGVNLMIALTTDIDST